MFGITTHQQIPDELLYCYASWDAYMATIWAALLNTYQLTSKMTAIEVAPGTSTKIGLALQKCHFQGKLYLVEPSGQSLSVVHQLYQSILPDADIYPIQQTLINSINHLPQRPDFILSNHPLDDMLLCSQENDLSQSTLFDWALTPSGEISPIFFAQWLKLSVDLNRIDAAKKAVIQQWQQIFLQIKPALTMISQYPSIALSKNKMQALNEYASDILNALKRSRPLDNIHVQSVLNQIENYNDQHIATVLLNANNWLVRVC
jgi:hypothetical protein